MLLGEWKQYLPSDIYVLEWLLLHIICYILLIQDLSSQHGRNVVNGKIIKREWLSTKDQKNILVRLEIPNGQGKGCKYAPGDHAVVFPANSDSDVDFVLERMTKLPEDPNMTVQIQEYNQQEGNQIIYDGISNIKCTKHLQYNFSNI